MKHVFVCAVLLLLSAGLCFSTGTTTAEVAEPGVGLEGIPKLTFTNDTCVSITTNGANYEWENLMLERFYGITLENVVVPGAEHDTKLVALIAAGDAPDVGRWRAPQFPAMWYQDVFQPVDDFAQVDHPVWDDVRDQMEEMTYKGRIMILPGDKTQGAWFYYHKTVFEENGLDDPEQLYEQGEWTWDTFLELCKALTQDTDGDGQIDTYGIGAGAFNRFADSLIASTGEAAYSLDRDGLLVSNHRSNPRIVEALEFLGELVDAGVVGPGGGNPNFQAFGEGKRGFYTNGLWMTSRSPNSELIERGVLGVLPPPRAPGVDQDYFSALVYAHMIPTGASNPQGGVAFAVIRRVRALYEKRTTPTQELKDITEEAIGIQMASPVADFMIQSTLRFAIPTAVVFTDIGTGVFNTNQMYNPIRNGNMSPIQAIESYVPQFQAKMQDIWDQHMSE